jgi:hypothetical protein
MNCRTARKLVQARHDGTLTAERGSALQGHLHACFTCSRFASQIDLAQQWLRDLPLEQPSESFEWRLKLRLSQAEREERKPALVASSPNRHIWTLQFVVSTAAAALLVLSTGFVLSQRQDVTESPGGTARVSPPPSTWAPSSLAQQRTGWPRLVPVRAGSPLGPELGTASLPSILGEARSDTTFLDEGKRNEPIQVYPVGY